MKLKNIVNLRVLPLQLVILLALGGCAKDLDEKLPDDFERDVHAISTFSQPIEIETINSNVELLAVKAEVASGIYALNEKAYRNVKMTKGPDTLAPLFENFSIESDKAGEKYHIEFKLTKSHLIAYMAVENKALSLASLSVSTKFNNKNQIPIFHYPINDYGIVRNSLNDLDEQTRFIEFKSTKKNAATHIKLVATPNNRVLNGLRGFHNEKIISKQLMENKNWSLGEIARFFNIATGNFNLNAHSAQNLKTKILDDHVYVIGQTTLGTLGQIEKIALRRGDPRITKCDKTSFLDSDLEQLDLCVEKPFYYGKASKAKVKLRLDDDGEELGIIDLDYVNGSTPAEFVVVTTNTQFNKFIYDERITGIDNKYIFNFDDVHEVTWTDKELQNYLKTTKSFNSEIVKTSVYDKMIWVLTPKERSSLQTADRAAIGKDPRFRACDNDVLSALNTKITDCVLSPSQSIIAVPSNIKVLFYDDLDLPKITMEPTLNENNADFLLVMPFIDSLDYTYARSYRDRLYDKSLLQGQTWVGQDLAKTLTKDQLKKYPTLVTKILNESLWILIPVKKSELDIFEVSMLDKDPRYSTCSHGIALHAKMDTQDCYLKPLSSMAVSHTIFEFEEQDNIILPALRVRTNVDRRLSNHVYLDPNGDVLDYKLGNRISESQNFRSKSDYHNVIKSGEELSKLLNIPEIKSSPLVKTKIIDSIIWVMVPTKISSLHLIEQSAVQNDPRYEKCSQEMADSAKIDINECILRPEFNRVGSFVQVAFEQQDNNDIPAMRIDYNVRPSDSSIIYFTDSNEATRFNYMRNIQTADRVITNKAQDIDLDARYVYVPMTHGTPREVIAADPFYQGNEKIVRLKWSEEGLEVYEEDRDPRFRANVLNSLPVLTIPGVHEDYKCLEDNNGNCTTGVEFDKDKTWDKKRFFVPDLERLKLRELNTLDVFTVESDPCLINTGVEVIHYEIKPGVINIELEKTYKTSNSFRCIIELYYADTAALTGMSNAGFKVRFFYSLVQLDKLVTKDYQPVAYPIPDHGEFGFFKDYKQRLNQNFDPERTNQDYFLSRWNPNRKELVYYLSDSFNEKGQEKIKEATYRAVQGMNKSLEKANSGLKITLKEAPGKKSGDLRNNMIVLITDPLSNGLLGYAPTVTNPETGEILQGHVNMYSGVIKSMSRRVWENMVDFSIENNKKRNIKKLTQKTYSSQKSHIDLPNVPEQKMRSNDMLQRLKRNKHPFEGKNIEKLAQKAYALNDERLKTKRPVNRDIETVNLDPTEKRLNFVQNRLNRWSENNAYAEEFFQIAHTVKTLLPGIKDISGVMNSDQTLKRWDLLSDKQKQQAMDIINPYVYTSTLVHEFGHNLGLRHNFTGSFDSDNFYSEAEALALGLKSVPAYSSIMDYAASNLDELTVFGKYDIAALRFAYAREVEDAQGKFHKIESSLFDFKNDNPNTSLKAYRFCTDENAELSASCNRFDEGSTLTEIATLSVQKYEENYKYRNFRDARDTFQAEGLDGYLYGRYMEFNRLRDIYEDYEFFSTIFGNELMEVGCGPSDLAQYPICKDINDRRDAVRIVADFFLKVLKTPDHICALVNPSEPNTIQEFRPLSKIYEDLKYSIPHVTKSCFDLAVKDKIEQEGLIVVAENGKFFNGFKDNDPNYIYSNDRAVRGVWVDKVMALKTLFQRESGKPLTETEHSALTDHSYVSQELGNFMRHIVLGEELNNPIPFKLEDGSEAQIPYSIDLSYVIEGPQRYNDWVKRFFDLPSSGNELLVRTLLKTAQKWGVTRDLKYRDKSRDLVNTFSIRKADIEDGMLGDELTKVSIKEIIYGASEANTYAKQMLDSIVYDNFLAQVPMETIVSVATYRLNPPMPSDLTPQQVIAVKLDRGLLEQLIQVATQGTELDLNFLIQNFGRELGLQIYTAYHVDFGYETKVENLKEALNIKIEISKAPDGSSDLEKRLFEVPLNLMISFARGELNQHVQNYVEILPHMPVHIRAVNW